MKHQSLFMLALALVGCGQPNPDVAVQTIELKGLEEPVEIRQDRWGLAHIYAGNQSDLFFAQGFNAARDRLFQLELWRRTATGTMAESFGERFLPFDVGNRLLRFRGDLGEELSRYHPDAGEIVGAFVDGINAYVDLVNEDPQLLPAEFRLLGIRPGQWTSEVVVSRHNGLYRNADHEVAFLNLARQIGIEKTVELFRLQPQPRIDQRRLEELPDIPPEALALYAISRDRPPFSPQEIVSASDRGSPVPEAQASRPFAASIDQGSNNWVLSSRRSATGQPILANDPHRSLQLPSLRYFVHLSAPGWDVIGGGEPALPGISIGHNRYGAWGLTIFAIDQEDLYVYETRPGDPPQYRYQDGWEAMSQSYEEVAVKGRSSYRARFLFTRHGPVLYYDEDRARAYALRAAWLRPGTSPYLAGLRFGQARDWEGFRQACLQFLMPSENMLWAGVDGTIGWQATGIAPRRRGWDGLLPVPGDGRYEWEGFLPPSELPASVNPEEGFLATANHFNLPEGYPHRIGFRWAEEFRYQRIREVLSGPGTFTIDDMKTLQQDHLSWPAHRLTALLKGVAQSGDDIQSALQLLDGWDGVLKPESSAAALYMAWQNHLQEAVTTLLLGQADEPPLPYLTILEALERPGLLGEEAWPKRDDLLIECLRQAIADLQRRFGNDPQRWKYGDPRFHHAWIRHPLSPAVNRRWQERLDAGPIGRGGNRHTIDMTTNNLNQNSGATFRIVVDLSDWDKSVAGNSPGQSGDPESSHYKDLFEPWARGEYFPLLYSRGAIEKATERVFRLVPKK